VYTVKLKTTSQSGIDWNLAFETTGIKVGMGLGETAKNAAGATWLRSPWKDSRLMIAALQTQGDVSTVIDTSVVTLNNQPAPIAITNNMTYISKVSVSELNNGSGIGGRMFTVEPAMLTTGFILNLMPTLLDNRSVMLQVQLNLSSLISKEKVDIGENAKNGHITTPETSAIQTLQRASLKSDETLILTGFRRDNNDNQRKGFFDLITGYAQAERHQEEVVVLITPQLVEGV
jgi:type IVB pilus formation R64 PilN family outer membrane protein